MVDDHATNRKVLMGQLSLCGVEAGCAGTVDEALALLREAAAASRPFDAALLDQWMPDGDGAELGRIINRDESIKSTRVVLLTSAAVDTATMRCWRTSDLRVICSNPSRSVI